MIMIVKTPGSQMGSPKAAEEGGEVMGGGRGESGGRSEVQARSTLTSTAPKARSRSGEVATLDEVPRILLRVSSIPVRKHANILYWLRYLHFYRPHPDADDGFQLYGCQIPETT